jgi:hypothetical protein
MSKLSWTSENTPEGVKIVLAGEISENSEFDLLASSISSPVTLDLAGIEKVNSPGIREWLEFMSCLTKRRVTVVLERCSFAIVHHLMMISNFKSNAEVRSIYVTYYCDTCDFGHSELVVLADNPIELKETISCPKCGSLATFDDVPNDYLSLRS